MPLADSASGFEDKEFQFSEKDFQTIREFVKTETGINLSEGKRNMVYSRLSRRLRQLDIRKFSDYLKLVKDPRGDELSNFINAITTNLTSFFRENHHFQYLSNTIIPSLLKSNELTRRIRIWSAGCSTGEEPYSLAMTLMESIPHIANWDVRILATDLDTNVLNTASTGVYDLERINGLTQQRKEKWFLKGKGIHTGAVRVHPKLQELISFKQLNLMNVWPMRGPFDVIFCRNVVIYFDKDTQRQLFNRYADILRPDGHIFLGHSESLFKVSDRFKLLGQTMYQRVK